MSHYIGTGTVNLCLNVPRDERDVWGQAAVRSGARSVGDYCKRMMLRGLEVENAEAAAKLKVVRRQYYGVTCAVLCLTTFSFALIFGQQDFRRAGRRVREERFEERVET